MSAPPVSASELRELATGGRLALAFARWQAVEADPALDPELLLEGVRLLERVGAPRRARRMLLRAWRRAPRDPHLRYGLFFEIMNVRGPLAAATHLAAEPAPREGYVAHRFVYAQFTLALVTRDFDRAEAGVARLREVGAPPRWALEAEADLLEALDENEAALAKAIEAHAHPGDDAASAMRRVHLLDRLGRSEEADALLAEVELTSEDPLFGLFAAQRALLVGAPDVARGRFRRARARVLAGEPELEERLRELEVEIAYAEGDLDATVALAKRCKGGWYRTLGERVEAPRGSKHRQLRVPFVPQGDKTCVPATLSALLRFEGLPADARSIADAICYDGTANHAERAWAEARGLVVREFTVDEPTLEALIDRDVPLSLVTTDARGGHMMAVTGYDQRLGTVSLMDPSMTVIQADARALLAALAPYGPRGAIVLPPKRAGAVADVALPDAALYDRLQEVHRALARDDTREAARHAAQMDPEHRLGLWARRALALHEGDRATVAALSRALLERYPKDDRSRFLLALAICELEPRARRLAELERLAGEVRDPSLSLLLAGELLGDARKLAEVERIARRALRVHPSDAVALRLLSEVARARDEPERAAELLRMSAHLEATNETTAEAVWRLESRAGRAEAALGWLERRARRALPRSALPAIRWAQALYELDRPAAVRAAVAAARAARPDDRDAIAFDFELALQQGFVARAQRLETALASSGGSGPSARARRARLAEARGDLHAAASLWAELARGATGSAGRALTALARLRFLTAVGPERDAEQRRLDAELEGRPLGFVEAVLSGCEDVRLRARVAARVLALDPDHLAGRGARALHAASDGRSRAAQEDVDALLAAAPRDPEALVVGAGVALRAGALKEASRLARAGMDQDVDDVACVSIWLAAARSEEARVKRFELLRERAAARSVTGRAVELWASEVREELPAAVILRQATSLLERRPDLWQAHTARIQLLLDLGQADDALEALAAAEARLPDSAGLLGFALGVRIDRGELGEAERLLRRLRCVRHDSEGARARVVLLARTNRGARALRVARAAAARYRQDPGIAQLLSRHDPDPALRRAWLERVIALAPWSEQSWLALHALAPDDALAAVVRWADADARWATPQLIAARLHRGSDKLEAALAYAERALRLDPSNAQAHDAKIIALARLGRIDDGLAACDAKGPPPFAALLLRVRRAMLLAEREAFVDAERELRRLLQEWPGYAPALRALARLPLRVADRLVACREVLARAPADLGTLELCGKLEREAGDAARAAATFARLAALVPDAIEAVVLLFEAQLACGEITAAEETLARIAALGERRAAACRVQLFAAYGDEDAALSAFSRFAAFEVFEPEQLRPVVTALVDALGAPRAVRALDPLVAASGADDIDRTWMAIRFELDPEGCGRFVRALHRRSGERAASALGDLLALAPAEGSLWLRFSLRFFGYARRAPRAYGHVARHLLDRGLLWAAVLWCVGWEKRRELPPWAHENLAIALAHLGFRRRAERVLRRCVARFGDAESAGCRARLAFLLACRGELDEAQRLLVDIDPTSRSCAIQVAIVRELQDGVGTLPEDALFARVNTHCLAIYREVHAIDHFVIERARRAVRQLKRPRQRGIWRLEEAVRGAFATPTRALLALLVAFFALVLWLGRDERLPVQRALPRDAHVVSVSSGRVPSSTAVAVRAVVDFPDAAACEQFAASYAPREGLTRDGTGYSRAVSRSDQYHLGCDGSRLTYEHVTR